MIVVNLFGGPGAGKSTTAAALFSKLKMADHNAELITEFAKDLTWEKRFNTLDNQLYVFAKQYHKFWRVKDGVDIVVTDSPLLFSLIYGTDESKAFQTVVKERFNEFDNINIVLNRKKKYNPKGRNQTEDEAKVIDQEIRQMLTQNGFEYYSVDYGIDQLDYIIELVEQKFTGLAQERAPA